MPEDDMHFLFTCSFSKDAWFQYPWYIKTEILDGQFHSILEILSFLLNSCHPEINLPNLYTFLWCPWKVRNENLFAGKKSNPNQVYAMMKAILQGSRLVANTGCETHQGEAHQNLGSKEHTNSVINLSHVQITNFSAGNLIYSDAAWEPKKDGDPNSAGLGIVLMLHNYMHCKQIHIAASSPPVASPLQAEAFALLLAVKVADILDIQDPFFLTDSLVLVSAARATSIFKAAGHWQNRPILAEIQASASFHRTNIHHISRNSNEKAHRQAKLARRIQSKPLLHRCLCTPSLQVNQCPIKDTFDVSSVQPFTLHSVKCV